MNNLPQAFIDEMKTLLPEREWADFFAIYQKKPYKGVRVNTLKCDKKRVEKYVQLDPAPASWEENGFYTQEEKVGGKPAHFAGLIYSQEPSAMCAAPMLEAKAGERVLDLCSAPGGKGTQLAAAMQGEGVLVLNEPVFSRAKILSQNVERMGVKNAVVVSAMPDELAKKLPAYFDKILVDAPCSGEGMFRKNAKEALAEWSEENVALCAKRQSQILDEATKMLKVGGRLVYSTCTFSYAEDEGQVRDYLQKHPQMRLIKQEKLYPHKVAGEGHFAALFEKVAGEETRGVKEIKPSCSKNAEQAYRAFEKDFFISKKASGLHEVNGVMYELPKGVFDWKGLQVLRVGVRLGELVNGRFEPSHSLAMASRADECRRVCSFAFDDEKTDKFLRGETVAFDGEKGWCLVCMDEYPIGLGKCVNGVLKNHIPKALRKMS